MNKINGFMRTELQQHPGCLFHTHRLWAAKLQIIFYYRITKSENFMYLWTKVALFHHVSVFIG